MASIQGCSFLSSCFVPCEVVDSVVEIWKVVFAGLLFRDPLALMGIWTPFDVSEVLGVDIFLLVQIANTLLSIPRGPKVQCLSKSMLLGRC